MIIKGIDIGILADLCQEQLRKTAKNLVRRSAINLIFDSEAYRI